MLGTPQFDKNPPLDLFFDMEQRFRKGDIHNYDQYLDLLEEQHNDIARYTVMNKHELFNRAMNRQIITREENL